MRLPDYRGKAGCAWRLDMDAVRQYHKLSADDDATLAFWVIEAPGSHPVWWWYRLGLVHLRPVPALAAHETLIYLPGATHEFVLEALNPDQYPPPIDQLPLHILLPANFAAQLICPSDAAAIKTIETQAIEPIVQGLLSPDTDYLHQWVERFGDNMVKDRYR